MMVKLSRNNVSGSRTQLLAFRPQRYHFDLVFHDCHHFDVDVLEFSDPSFESVEENIRETQSRGDSAGLIVIIAADVLPDAETVLRLMCDETLSQKT